MLAEERKNKIVDIVNRNKVVKVSMLSKVLNTTEATIRRDLDELQEINKIRRVHGGAISLNPTSRLFSTDELSILCKDEKKRIAKKAYKYVDNNDALLLDASTTVLELVMLIAEGDKKGISILTNSFNVVSALRYKNDIKVFHTGGQVGYNMNYSTGFITEKIIRDLRVDKCFVGTNGIDPVYGYSVPSFEDASVKKYMLNASQQRFVLADHTKFGETYMGKYADFSGDIDYLITDYFPENTDRELFESSVNLVVA